MANIIGEEIEGYVAAQINARQLLHGSGAGQDVNNPRNDFQINLLNSNTSWIKLASGVSVDNSKLTEIGLPSSLSGMELAKNYILFAGSSKFNGNKLIQREGFLPQDSNSSYTYGSYGYSPMPGITDADIKSLNRGSLKKATVKIKINNKQQFDIIDLLYLRLGYTVLLEWGNSIYTPDGKTREVVRNTLIDDPDLFFNPSFSGDKSYRDILGPIQNTRRNYSGNYDALLGKISNFDWTFNPDGTYDATITIISLGDVVESLKLNISTNKGFSEFLSKSTSTISTSTSTPTQDIIEDSKDSNSIASMLWAWKFVNRNSLTYVDYDKSLYIRDANNNDNFLGAFLNPSESTITNKLRSVKFYYVAYEDGLAFDGNPKKIRDIDPFKALDYPTRTETIEADQYLSEKKRIKQEMLDELTSNGKDTFVLPYIGFAGATFKTYKVDVRAHFSSTKTISTDSPLTIFEDGEACWLNTDPHQYYLKFGALLKYISETIIPKINNNTSKYEDKPPLFEIDFETESNFAYSLPNQISLDPRVCIVRNSSFTRESGENIVFNNLPPFRVVDGDDPIDSNPNKAYIMNIYLNFEFLVESLNSSSDERGDVNVFSFLKAICDGLNKALGGINNLEPIVNEETNTLTIIDTTPIPLANNNKSQYILQLYGYNKNLTGYASNFIRNINLKTAITPEYATMITVGATAGGYVKGTEATAFSKWNSGLIDRFKEELTPGDENSIPENGKDEAVINYNTKMLATTKITQCYGFSGNIQGGNSKNLKISTDSIESNISVGTEYFKYLISSQKNQQGGTIGFIPFKISFTMDGLSGIKIYNKLNIDTRFLPRAYGNTLDLIVTGISHKLANSDWETEIEATVIPKTSQISTPTITLSTNNDTTNQPTPNPQQSPSLVGGYNTLKDNNPFNIIANSNSLKFKGVTGTKIAPNSGKTFIVFDTIENGVRAGLVNLAKYFTKRKLRTIRDIIRVYAGGSEGYINYVVDSLKKDWNKSTTPDFILPQFKGNNETNSDSIKMFKVLSKAIFIFEGGDKQFLSDIDSFPINKL